jgi:putative membrane protein
MTVDAILAIVHHLAAFGLVALLIAEFVLLRARLDADGIRRFGQVDILYGIAAGVVVVAGVARLFFGAVDIGFYLGNAFFWLKMASLATVALVSIQPTILGVRWRQAVERDAAFTPPAADLAAIRRSLTIEVIVLPLIPISAALMARGIGSL